MPQHAVPAHVHFGAMQPRKSRKALASSTWLKWFVSTTDTWSPGPPQTTSFSPSLLRQHFTCSGRALEQHSWFKRESWIFFTAASTRVWPPWTRAQARLHSDPCPKSTCPSGSRLHAQTPRPVCLLAYQMSRTLGFRCSCTPGHVFSC